MEKIAKGNLTEKIEPTGRTWRCEDKAVEAGSPWEMDVLSWSVLASVLAPVLALGNGCPILDYLGSWLSSWRCYLGFLSWLSWLFLSWLALGVQLHALGQVPAWNNSHATGTFDFGQVLGWQDEPQALQYGVPAGQENEAQRLNAWVTAGHSIHLGARRRSTLGLHLFTGWTHVWSRASVTDERLDLDASASDDYGLFNLGALLKFDYRFSEWIGVHLQAAAPFGVGSSYVNTLFHVGLGLTAYLR